MLAVIMALYYKRSAKPVKYFIIGSFSGLISLAAIQLLAADLLGLSVYSIVASVILGIPGVATMVIVNLVL